MKNRPIDKAFEEACRFIEDFTGTCPLDAVDFEPWKSCNQICDGLVKRNELYKCWVEYFKKFKDEG